MTQSSRTLSSKGFFLFVVVFLILTDLAVLLDVPVLRPVLGFLFFTVVPGLLILNILRLNQLSLTERFALSVGLSVAFLIFAGLFINSVYPLLGYATPLSTNSVIVSFNIILIILAIISYRRNKNFPFNLSSFKLDTSEKTFLLLPATFPLLSILGMYLMNSTDYNIVLMVMLFLIPAYIILIAMLHHRVPQRTYPAMLFLIGLSLLLLVSLRSSHIIGNDTHTEYYLFQLVASEQRWQIFMGNVLDACLSVSLLPTIYQSLMNINPEYLFKILYPLLFSVSPLVIYVISQKYIGAFYAFLASFFFMSQFNFIWTSVQSRTNTSILFVALVIMALLNDNMSKLAKRLLVIIFAASCIVSHYSTTYISFFVFLLTWIGMGVLFGFTSLRKELVTRSGNVIKGNKSLNSSEGRSLARHSVNPSEDSVPSIRQFWLDKGITATFLALFLVMLFFWYSQVTVSPFSAGVGYIHRTLINLSEMFVLETRGTAVAEAYGQTLVYSAIPASFKFVSYWLGIAFITIGVLSTIARYKSMVSVPGTKQGKIDFLKSRIDAEYWMLSLACCATLALSVILPYALYGYGMSREYLQMAAALSMFFVIGGITVAKFLKVKPYWLLLLVLIPYFMSSNGTIDRICGAPGSVVLNSEGSHHAYYYIYDRESYAAKWLQNNAELKDTTIRADKGGVARLISQGGISAPLAALLPSTKEDEKNNGYIYLTCNNVVNKDFFDLKGNLHSLEGYQVEFTGKNKIYSNGGSEIYR